MNKHKLFQIVTVAFLLTQLLPPVKLLLPFSEALKIATFVGIASLLFPNLWKKGSFVALLIYTLETFFYFLFGHPFFDSINTVINPFLMMGSALLLSEYIFQYDKDFKFTKLTLIVSVCSLVIMSLISIPILRTNPNIIRYVYSINSKGDNEILAATPFLISWDSVTGISTLIASIVFLCRKVYLKHSWLFYFWLFTLMVFYYVVFRSNITTPLVLSSVMIVLALLFSYETLNSKNITKIVLTGLLALALMTPAVLVPALDFAQSHMTPGGATYKRMDDMKATILYGEVSWDSDIETRNEIMSNSIDLFLESPLLGTFTPERIANHSYFADRLACHGMLFIIPLIMIFIYHFKSVYRRLIHTKLTYMFGFSAFLFLLIFKSESVWLFGFFLLPILCRYIDAILDHRYDKIYRKL